MVSACVLIVFLASEANFPSKRRTTSSTAQTPQVVETPQRPQSSQLLAVLSPSNTQHQDYQVRAEQSPNCLRVPVAAPALRRGPGPYGGTKAGDEARGIVIVLHAWNPGPQSD